MHKQLALATLVFVASEAHPQEASLENGFVTFDHLILLCSKADPKRANTFRLKFEPITACGKIDSVAAANIRASESYKTALEVAIKAEPREATRSMNSEYCSMVLKNIDEHCATFMGTWKTKK